LKLLSPAVLAIIVAAPIVLGLFRGTWRQAAFLALNLTFLVGCVLGVSGTASTLAFTAAGYVAVQAVRRGGSWAFPVAITVIVALFICMKRYTFLEALLPSTILTSALSTVGLSFLFFKILHVLIDARSGTLGPFDSWTFANYCANFATFAMGPIQRYQDHRRQWLENIGEVSLEQQLDAVIRILVGFVKAYVLAAWIKQVADVLTVDALARSTLSLLTGIYAFNLYLYLNFAGYCDVVIGAGALFGVTLPENFDEPFLARNIGEFWQRQHRSLTQWLTDYVFTPLYKHLLETRALGLSALVAADISLMATMIVSGLWHGTTLAFLIFGLIHGAYLVVYRTYDAAVVGALGRRRARAWDHRWWVRAVGIAITFNAVSFSFLFFLLDVPTAFGVLRHMLRS
jgi:membrane protein involved in D-alanine export